MRFLKAEKKTVDLVGNEKMKASASVRHLVLPCSRAARPQLIPDIIRCYSRYVAPPNIFSVISLCFFYLQVLNVLFVQCTTDFIQWRS